MPAPTGYNKGPEDGWEVLHIVLEKTTPKQSFGLAITGGVENPNHDTGDKSVIVTDVVQASPAALANVRKEDVILAVNDRPAITHRDTVESLKSAGLVARLQIRRVAPKKAARIEQQKESSPKTESDRGRARKKPRDMENESGEKKRSSRSRSRGREGEENGEKNGEKKRSRSRSRNREGEDGEKPRRSRSKHRGEGEEGEDGEKPRRSRSKHRGEGEEGGEDGDKPRRSRSKHRGEGEEGDKPRRSRSRARGEDGEDGATEKKSRSRSKSRSRDDLTRSKSKESLHIKKSKSKENLSGAAKDAEAIEVILDRGERGYGFSLGHQFFLRDFAKESPAANNTQLEKGDILLAINDQELQDLKLSDCINIIRDATQQVKLKIVKKPKEAMKAPVVEAETEKAPKQPPRPTRPAEAPEAEVVVAKAREEKDELDSSMKRDKQDKSRQSDREKRDRSPPRDQLNDTKDSWAAASPEKSRYQSQSQPSQEVENMDAKLERLKAGRKFERRLSELPNARVISFRKSGSVGIQVAGGNEAGIFVAAIRKDSAAAQEGLQTGDRIIMCNEIDFTDITREEAVLILLALPDDVSLVVESNTKVFESVKNKLGDNFYIRTNFDYLEKVNQHELTFRKGEIYNVRDTMYQGLIGYWQAQRVGKNGQMLERGVMPNKSRAEQLSIAQKMEERQMNTPGRSKVKRRGSTGGTLKRHKFVSQDRLDESSFAEGVQIPAYERVVLKVADFMRPVVVLGALADLVRFKLLEEMPDRFDVPTPMDVGRNDDRPYADSIKIAEIRNVIAKNKHCLLDITPEGIEMLMHAQLCPIVILLKSPSRGAVKEMRASLVKELMSSPTGVPGFNGDPLVAKQVKRVLNNANKLEEYHPHIFTAKINTHIAGGDALSREFYIKLKEIVFSQQAQSAWMPEEKTAEVHDDMVFHPPNYMSYLSGADSDTEGESMTSSPVLAKKHFEDDESPLPSPDAEQPPYQPPPAPEPVVEAEVKDRHRSRHRHRSRDRDDDESPDREQRRSKKKHHRSRSRDHSRDREDKRRDEEEEEKEERDLPPPSFKPEQPPYREPPQPEYREEPPYREPPRATADHRDDYREPPRSDNRDDYRDDYRSPPRNDNRGERDAPDYSYRPPPPRDDYRDYRQPPPPSVEERIAADQLMSQFEEPDDEDLPVLRNPKYELPKPIPDSPPTRRPPEVRQKPAVNAVKVFPSDFNKNSDEMKRPLRKVPDPEDDENDRPPYRPPPPPEKEDVPEKVLTLQERMNKFQQKVTTSAPPPSRRAPVDDEPPPPARPAAPRNYIVDSRYRGQPAKPELYAQNTYKPSAQFPEVKHIAPKQQQQVEEPYANVRNAYMDETEAPPRSKHPGYDYVKPYSNKQRDDPPSPTHNYDYPRAPTHDYDYPRHTEEPHYQNPTSSSRDGYQAPPAYNRGRSYDDDNYPAYQAPSFASARNGHDPANTGEDEPRVIATARGVFDHRGGLLESAETNVSIYIPAGALPEGKKQEIYFKVCQDSKYMPPLDSTSGETLLSPLVMCGPHGLKFRKPIELRLPHKGASNDSMAFSLKSSDSPVGHPGQWKNVKLGGKDLDSGRAYQVTEDTVSVLVDHF